MEAFIFFVDDKDREKEHEISLNGVIDDKIAKGNYITLVLPEGFTFTEVRFAIPNGLLFFR